VSRATCVYRCAVVLAIAALALPCGSWSEDRLVFVTTQVSNVVPEPVAASAWVADLDSGKQVGRTMSLPSASPVPPAFWPEAGSIFVAANSVPLDLCASDTSGTLSAYAVAPLREVERELPVPDLRLILHPTLVDTRGSQENPVVRTMLAVPTFGNEGLGFSGEILLLDATSSAAVATISMPTGVMQLANIPGTSRVLALLWNADFSVDPAEFGVSVALVETDYVDRGVLGAGPVALEPQSELAIAVPIGIALTADGSRAAVAIWGEIEGPDDVVEVVTEVFELDLSNAAEADADLGVTGSTVIPGAPLGTLPMYELPLAYDGTSVVIAVVEDVEPEGEESGQVSEEVDGESDDDADGEEDDECDRERQGEGHLYLVSIDGTGPIATPITLPDEVDLGQIESVLSVWVGTQSDTLFVSVDKTFYAVRMAGPTAVESISLDLPELVSDADIGGDDTFAAVGSGPFLSKLTFDFDAGVILGEQPIMQSANGLIKNVAFLPVAEGAIPDRDGDGLADSDEDRNENDVVDPGETDPDDPDCDGDGVPDGIDKRRLTPSAWLSLAPKRVSFSSVEGRADPAPIVIEVDNAGVGTISWQANITVEPGLNWLSVAPSVGMTPSKLEISTSIEGLTASRSPYLGTVTVSANPDVAENVQTIEVVLVVEEAPETFALWLVERSAVDAPSSILNGITGDGYGALGNLLLSEFNYTNREVAYNPFLFGSVVDEQLLEGVDLLVVSTIGQLEALVESEQEAVLEFLLRGGSVFVVGDRDSDRTSVSFANSITELFGTRLRSGTSVSTIINDFAVHPITYKRVTVDEVELDGTLEQVNISGGAELLVLGLPSDPLAFYQTTKVMMTAAELETGRAVVFCDETPFTNAQIGLLDHEQLSRNVFLWLSPGGAETYDRDRDGIPDRYEDLDGDGIVDPGETDPLDWDTDGDGVSDGAEDFNGNGVVDLFETDPTNADTDGDSMPDGSDPFPTQAPPPRIDRIDPASGPATGGTLVTIVGSRFLEGAVVMFGDQESDSVTFVSSTQVLAVSPPGNAGETVDIKVIDPETSQSSLLRDAFSYVVTIDPTSGPATGGTQVTITGSGFREDAVVMFGDEQAAGVEVVSPTELVAVSPPGTTGESVAVKIIDPETSESVTAADQFTYLGLTTVHVGRNSAMPGEQTTVQVRLDTFGNGLDTRISTLLFRIEYDSDYLRMDENLVLSDAASDAHKEATANVDNTLGIAVILVAGRLGFEVETLPSGDLATLTFDVLETAPTGRSFAIDCSSVSAADEEGEEVLTLSTDGFLFVGSIGDVNGDEIVNAIDIQIVVNQVLGISTQTEAGDVNGDGSWDAADIQLVINAALGKPL